MRIAVLGVGLVGGSIGLAAGRRVPGAEVVGFDPGEGVLATALDRGALHRGAATVAEAVEGASVCFACGPVGALPALVAEALSSAGPDCVVSDVGSTKRAIARTTAGEPRFVGGHPIAGAESEGVAHARADLFEGVAWYLAPGARSSGLLYERLHRLLATLGARVVAIDPEAHDRLLAAVSHLPHVMANVLAAQAATAGSEEREALARTGPSLRDATRVAGANSGIWPDIYLSNADAIATEIDATVERLRSVAAALRDRDGDAIRRWNDHARESRRQLVAAPEQGEVEELRVTVPNRPGIVAQVALALGRAGVDIVDMALAPAPGMRSGSITLWVSGAPAAERAQARVSELGFPVARVR